MNVEPHKTQAGTTRKKRKYLILGLPERSTKSRHELIAEVAYFKAERRGFTGGDPNRDWHEAEKEVEELLRRGRPF